MTLDFHSVVSSGINERSADPNLMWWSLEISFKDTVLDNTPSVAFCLPVGRTPETTIAAIDREARDRAKTILREALALLEANDVEQLRNMEKAREQRDNEHIAAFLEDGKGS